MFKTDQLTIIKRDHNSTLQMVLSVHHTVYLNSIMMTKPLVEYPILLPTTTNLFLSVCQLFPIPTLSVCLSTVSVPKLSLMSDVNHRTLHSPGGKLELCKCFYYMLNWSFTADGKAYVSPPEYHSENDKLTDSKAGADIPMERHTNRTQGAEQNHTRHSARWETPPGITTARRKESPTKWTASSTKCWHQA